MHHCCCFFVQTLSAVVCCLWAGGNAFGLSWLEEEATRQARYIHASSCLFEAVLPCCRLLSSGVRVLDLTFRERSSVSLGLSFLALQDAVSRQRAKLCSFCGGSHCNAAPLSVR